MSQYRVIVNGKEIIVDDPVRRGGSMSFSIAGKSYAVDISPRLAPPQSAQQAASAPAAVQPQQVQQGPGEVRAPMPGLVTQISVKAGEDVALGQKLMVIEAMKMENNITSPKNGKVRTVHVEPGQEVENRRLLISLE